MPICRTSERYGGARLRRDFKARILKINVVFYRKLVLRDRSEMSYGRDSGNEPHFETFEVYWYVCLVS